MACITVLFASYVSILFKFLSAALLIQLHTAFLQSNFSSIDVSPGATLAAFMKANITINYDRNIFTV